MSVTQPQRRRRRNTQKYNFRLSQKGFKSLSDRKWSSWYLSPNYKVHQSTILVKNTGDLDTWTESGRIGVEGRASSPVQAGALLLLHGRLSSCYILFWWGSVSKTLERNKKLFSNICEYTAYWILDSRYREEARCINRNMEELRVDLWVRLSKDVHSICRNIVNLVSHSLHIMSGTKLRCRSK